MKFVKALQESIRRHESLVCVGLDSDIEKIPNFLTRSRSPKSKVQSLKINHDGSEAVYEFNKAIIDETYDLVCTFKLNIAFYELLGPAGGEILRKTRDYIPSGIPVIIDAKRADIGNTSNAYARALLDFYNFDGITVNPYLGYDSLKPFIDYESKGIFILCRTSNPGSTDFQELNCGGRPLYQEVAQKLVKWNQYGNIGAVVGATYPKELEKVRDIVGEEIPLLIPGVGKQEGELKQAVGKGTNSQGEMAIINSSRGIIFASSGEDFAQAARAAALKLKEEINHYR